MVVVAEIGGAGGDGDGGLEREAALPLLMVPHFSVLQTMNWDLHPPFLKKGGET